MSVELGVLAAFLPSGFTVMKAVLSEIRRRADAKSSAASGEFRDAMDDETVKNARAIDELARGVDALRAMVVTEEDWKGVPPHEHPAAEDVLTRAEEYARASWRAGSHGKRKILWNAFFSTFKPDFYRDGWSSHLWRIAEQVEYPECRLLADRIRFVDDRKAGRARDTVDVAILPSFRRTRATSSQESWAILGWRDLRRLAIRACAST